MSHPGLFDASTLDIEYVSRVIGDIVTQYFRKMEQGVRQSVEFRADPRASAELAYDIRRTLLALDQARTDNIRSLREQLLEMHMRNPGPIWVGATPKEPTT